MSEVSVSQALASLVRPQVIYPNPHDLEKIQAALDKEFPPQPGYGHNVVWSVTVGAKLRDEQLVFLAYFWLNVKEGGDWVIHKIAGINPFQGPFEFYPQLDKPIVAIRNVFGSELYICLEEEKEAEKKRAVQEIRNHLKRVTNAFKEATIINPATVPTG